VVLRLLARFWKGSEQGRVTTGPELANFLSRRAAFAAQKAVIGYCEVKAGVDRDKLFAYPDFQRELEICRWESFAAVLADSVVLAEGLLRPHAGGPGGAAALGARLAALYRDVLAAERRPPHRPDGWDDLAGPFALRLAEAQAAPPRGPAEIAAHACRRVTETLPIQPEHKRADRESIHGGVKFQFLALHDALLRALDPAAVAADLLAGAPVPEPALAR